MHFDARFRNDATIAHFISTLQDDIARVFAAVLAVSDRHGLIGRELFAIDGVKLPSNASKQRSGTRAEFEHQSAKLEAAATTMVARHCATDALPPEPDLAAKAVQRITRLERDAAQLRDWLAAHPNDRHGPATASLRKLVPRTITGCGGIPRCSAQTAIAINRNAPSAWSELDHRHPPKRTIAFVRNGSSTPHPERYGHGKR